MYICYCFVVAFLGKQGPKRKLPQMFVYLGWAFCGVVDEHKHVCSKTYDVMMSLQLPCLQMFVCFGWAVCDVVSWLHTSRTLILVNAHGFFYCCFVAKTATCKIVIMDVCKKCLLPATNW